MGELVCFSVILQAKINVLEGKVKAVENSSHTKVKLANIQASLIPRPCERKKHGLGTRLDICLLLVLM